MHCPISRAQMIAITGNSNLLKSTAESRHQDNNIFRNVSIIFPKHVPALYGNGVHSQKNAAWEK